MNPERRYDDDEARRIFAVAAGSDSVEGSELELDRGLNEPIRNLYQAVWSTAYQAHPYHHPTIGWRADVEEVGAESLRGFYDRFYWPNNATVSIIGNCEEAVALELVASEFSRIPSGPSTDDVARTRARSCRPWL